MLPGRLATSGMDASLRVTGLSAASTFLAYGAPQSVGHTLGLAIGEALLVLRRRSCRLMFMKYLLHLT